MKDRMINGSTEVEVADVHQRKKSRIKSLIERTDDTIVRVLSTFRFFQPISTGFFNGLQVAIHTRKWNKLLGE